jgi:uncharacterized membrane protein
MEIVLIVGLAIAVFAIWRSSQDAIEQLRGRIKSLEVDIGFLRMQLAALVKPHTASPAGEPAPTVRQPAKMRPEVAPLPVPQPEPAQPSAAQHAPQPAIAAFKPPAQAPISTPPAGARLPAFTPPASVQPPISAPPAKAPAPPVPLPMEPARPPVQRPAMPKPPTEARKPPVAPKPAEADAQAVTGGKLFSLEERLGANWLNKIGIAIVVIGIGYFLAYKLQTWGPGGKVLCGYAVSLTLLAGGVWLERKPTYRIFARGGIGGGWALAFFTTYAMHHLSAAYVLSSLAADLVLMMVVAAGMVAHSLRYRSQTVTGLAFLLGFVTLLTSHLEGTDGNLVFSLTASVVLAVALVMVTTARHWAWLELGGLIAVYLSHLVWLTKVLPQNHAAFAEFWPSTALILLYWLIFRAAYVLRTPRDQKEENISSLSAVLNSIGVLGLLKVQAAHPEWAFWAESALGAVEMGLAFRVRSRRRQAFVVLSTIATVLLISAVPFKFHGVSWPVLWLLEAQVLAVCGLRLGEPVFRRLGLLAGVVTGGVLAFHDVMPLLLFRLDNPDPARHLSLTAALALAAVLYWIHSEVYPRRWPRIAEDDGEAFALRITSWLGVAAAAAALWVALPYQWVPVGWLALMLLLGLAAHRFGAALLALEADILTLASAAVLIFHHFVPLALFRLDYPDPSRHAAETVVLALAAAACWIRSEVYPRVLPRILPGLPFDLDLSLWQDLARPATSWLGLAAAAAALWAALPDLWVPVGWLALVLLLAFAAHRFGGIAMAVEADALVLGAGAVLLFHHVLPLALFRLANPDFSRHTAETAALTLAAAAFWVRSEVYPRVLRRFDAGSSPDFDMNAWQAFALPVGSWLGAAAAAAALWVALPAPWVVVGWLALVVALGLAADGIKARTLALQADLLAVAAFPGLLVWDLGTQGWWDYRAPLIASVALLYAGMRRRTAPAGAGDYVAPAYSWAATLLMAYVATVLASDQALGPVWVALGLALFEIGRLARKGYLRWQAFLLVALAFGRYFAIDLPMNFGPAAPIVLTADGRLLQPGRFSLVNSLLLEILILAAIGYWLLERTRNRERCTRAEHILGLTASALGTLSIALWFAYRFPSEWVPAAGGEAWVTPIWAGMATVLLALAWLARRRAFLVQSMALVVAAVGRGLFLDLFADSPAGFWHGPLFHLGMTAIVLLAALPFAFRLRGERTFAAPTISFPPELGLVFRSPEQWFFFAAFGLEVVALAVKLSSGHITIAWSLLGLGVFLFALAVGERSYRLAGLLLLLVCVAKILLMDVWQLPLSQRWITFAVLGTALVAVNFLYTRYAAVIRKFV